MKTEHWFFALGACATIFLYILVSSIVEDSRSAVRVYVPRAVDPVVEIPATLIASNVYYDLNPTGGVVTVTLRPHKRRTE